MKSLTTYINENAELYHTIYLLDNWFKDMGSEKQEFLTLISNCRNDNNSITNLQKYLEQTNLLKNSYKKFIIYSLDNPNIENMDIDYIYHLGKIIMLILNNHSCLNTYNKIEEIG